MELTQREGEIPLAASWCKQSANSGTLNVLELLHLTHSHWHSSPNFFNICLLVIKICILPLQAFINHFEAFLWKHANISKTLNPLMLFILHFNLTTHWYWWISHDRVWNPRKVQHIYLRRRTRKHLPVKKMNNKYPRKTNCLFLNYFLFTLDDE